MQMTFMERLNERLTIVESLLKKLEPVERLMERIAKLEEGAYTTKSVLTHDEACMYLGLQASYLYKLTANREIPYSKPHGKRIYFDKQDLDLWAKQNRMDTVGEIVERYEEEKKHSNRKSHGRNK